MAPREPTVSREDLERLSETHSNRSFLVHDGYCPWAYGVPMNPTKVSISTALRLLNQIDGKSRDEMLEALQSQGPPPLQYSEVGDNLYSETGQNRFLTFRDSGQCISEPDEPPL